MALRPRLTTGLPFSHTQPYARRVGSGMAHRFQELPPLVKRSATLALQAEFDLEAIAA
jgi:hypothetical protein